MDLRRNRVLISGLLGVLCLLLPGAAKADSFDWTYQGTDVLNGVLSSGSGELDATDGIITGISGTFNGLTITALVAPGGPLGNDNILQIPPAPLFFTPGGVSFLESAGDQINIFGAIGMECTFPGPVCVPDGDNRYGSLSDDGNFDLGIFTLVPVMTAPEPGTIAMLLPSLLFFGLFLRWRRSGTESVAQFR
jgi:hypothetical protein